MDDSLDWDSPSPTSSPEITKAAKPTTTTNSSSITNQKLISIAPITKSSSPVLRGRKSARNSFNDDIFNNSKDSIAELSSVNSSVNLSPAVSYNIHADSPTREPGAYLSNFVNNSADLDDSILGELLGGGGGVKPLKVPAPTLSKSPKEPIIKASRSSAGRSSRSQTKLEPLETSGTNISIDSNVSPTSEKRSTKSPNNTGSGGKKKRREVVIRNPRNKDSPTGKQTTQDSTETVQDIPRSKSGKLNVESSFDFDDFEPLESPVAKVDPPKSGMKTWDVYTHIYTHTRTYTHIHAHTHTYTHTHIHT